MKFRHKAKRWSRKSEQQFFGNLSNLLQNGYTLPRSLEVMEATCPALQCDLKVVQGALSEGQTLAESVKSYVRPNIVAELSLVMLHGCQSDLLKAISEREQQYYDQLKRLNGILCYPILLLVFLAGIGGYMIVYLMPHIGALLMNVVSVLCVGASVIGVLWGIRYYRKQSQLRRYELLTRIPILGPIMTLFIQQVLYLQLGYLLQSGVSLYAIVEYCQVHDEYWVCQLIGKPVKTAWSQGQTLDQGLNQVMYLSVEAKMLFMRGNQTSQIGEDLIQLAKHTRIRQEQRMQIALALVQPVFFALIGLIVIGLYMMLLLPMYDQMLTIGGME